MLTAVSMMQHRKMSYLKKTVVLLLDNNDDDIEDDFIYIKNTKTVELWWRITYLMISREMFWLARGKKTLNHASSRFGSLFGFKEKSYKMYLTCIGGGWYFLIKRRAFSKRIKYGLYYVMCKEIGRIALRNVQSWLHKKPEKKERGRYLFGFLS